MEITPIPIKSRHEPITQPESMEVFDLVRSFTDQLSRAIDTSIICFLNDAIGGDWKYEDVVLEKIPDSPDIPGMASFILYQGKPVGRIRHTVNSEGQKITGDICIEIIEEAKSEKRRFQQKVV